MTSKHDQIAKNLATKFGTKYKSNKGIDLVLPNRVIEVETKKAGFTKELSKSKDRIKQDI